MLTQQESILFRAPGDVHPSVQVVQMGNIRYLRFGDRGGWQGALHVNRPEHPVFPYQRAFSAAVSNLFNVHRFLSLGVGTGTSLRTVRKYFPSSQLDGVEIDETVLNLAIEFFGAPAHDEAQYWVGDGVKFLSRELKRPYDLIFVDAYMSNKVYGPSMQPTFANVLYNSVIPGGTVMANLIAGVPLRGPLKQFLDAAAKQFAEVWLLPVGIPLVEQNTLAIFHTRTPSLHTWRSLLNHHELLFRHERLLWPLRLRRFVTKSRISRL